MASRTPGTGSNGTCTARARTQRSVLGLAVIEDLHDLRDVALHVQGRVHRNRHDAGAKAAEAHLGNRERRRTLVWWGAPHVDKLETRLEQQKRTIALDGVRDTGAAQ